MPRKSKSKIARVAATASSSATGGDIAMPDAPPAGSFALALRTRPLPSPLTEQALSRLEAQAGPSNALLRGGNATASSSSGESVQTDVNILLPARAQRDASAGPSARAIGKLRARARIRVFSGGREIEDLLDPALQPRKFVEGVWVRKEPMMWRREVLEALAALVELDVGVEEWNGRLRALVEERIGTEGRVEGKEGVRKKEVWRVVEGLKAEGVKERRVVDEEMEEEMEE